MTPTGCTRLKKLASFLTHQPSNIVLDLRNWKPQYENSPCGCVIGLALEKDLFLSDGLIFVRDSPFHINEKRAFVGHKALAEFFSLTERESVRLFPTNLMGKHKVYPIEMAFLISNFLKENPVS